MFGIFKNSGSGSTSSYLTYVALLTQTSTNAPVATVLENTFGGTPVWTRGFAGIYTCTLASAFPLAKTFVINGLAPNGGFDFIAYTWMDSPPNSFRLTTIDIATYTPLDELLTSNPIEIRVYP